MECYWILLINYSIYNTCTAKCVGIVLVTFLLSYSHLGLYGLHLGLYGLHLGLYGFHLGLYRNPCIWLVRSSVSSVTRERSSWEFMNVGPIFDFGKKCRNRNTTTTTTPTFLSGGHFDLGTFRLYTQLIKSALCVGKIVGQNCQKWSGHGANFIRLFKPLWATDTGENRICSRGSKWTLDVSNSTATTGWKTGWNCFGRH